jgi:hypothetical protein
MARKSYRKGRKMVEQAAQAAGRNRRIGCRVKRIGSRMGRIRKVVERTSQAAG